MLAAGSPSTAILLLFEECLPFHKGLSGLGRPSPSLSSLLFDLFDIKTHIASTSSRGSLHNLSVFFLSFFT